MPQIPSLQEAIGLLASGVGVGAVLSFLFAKFPWFNGLPSATKGWIVFLVSLALPLLATLALQFIPAQLWAQLEPYWRALAVGFLTWAGSQAFHLLSKSKAAQS